MKKNEQDMKKFIWTALAAVGALTSCLYEAGNTPDDPSAARPVRFSETVDAYAKTRAMNGHPIENVPETEHAGLIPLSTDSYSYPFGVYAWQHGTSTEVPFTALTDKAVTRRGTDEAPTYSYGNPIVPWPETGELSFIAYYPHQGSSDVTAMKAGATGGNLSVARVADETALKIEYTVPSDGGKHIDLMFERKEAMTASQGTPVGTVGLVFNHALARMRFSVRLEGFGSKTVTVKSIAITSAKRSGTLELNHEDTPAWVLDPDEATDTPITVNMAVSKSDLLLIPQPTAALDLQIVLTVDGEDYPRTIPLAAVPDLEMNRIYDLGVTLSEKSQELEVKILDWQNGEIGPTGFNGPYHFSVDPGEMIFEVEGGTLPLTVDTNHPGGWKATVWDNDDGTGETSRGWLKISDDDETNDFEITGAGKTIGVFAQDHRYTTTPRTAWILVKADDRLTLKVRVTQKEFVWRGRSAAILYWDEVDEILRVGRWGKEDTDYYYTWSEEPGTYGPVNSNNMIFTKFGGVVGFTNAQDEAFTTASIMFNPTTTATGSMSYGTAAWSTNLPDVPSYLSTHFTDIKNVSLGNPDFDNFNPASTAAQAYHTLANVRAGRGDICRLVGMTATEIANFQNDEELYTREAQLAQPDQPGGWRLPTTSENYKFVGYEDWATRTPSYGDSRRDLDYRFWVDDVDSNDPAYRPLVDAGSEWSGGYFPTGSTGAMWNQNSYFLPAAGRRSSASSGTPSNQGTNGHFWSSTPETIMAGYYLRFYDNSAYPSLNANMGYGHAIRCVRNE